MKLYSENKDYKLYQGNMLDMLEVIKSNSIDSIITDPPYELNFMNKGWDNSGIAFQPSTWRRCYEVLKPGGYLLAFGGSRTFHRIACAIEDAGFEIRDTIMWLYGSGFPKSMNISLMLDKKEGLQGQRGVGGFNVGGIQEQNNRKAKLYIGSTTDGSKQKAYTDFKSDLAKQWQGWGTALKPSFEPIIVARKPFKGSLVDNVIEYGVGGINIDECRVGDETISIHNAPKGTFAGGEYNRGSDTESYRDSTGRFPANTILTYDETDFDEVCGGFPNTKNSKRSSKYNKDTEYTNTYIPPKAIYTENNTYGDSGSASRYFMNCKYTGKDEDFRRYIYTPKASKKDRDEGLDIEESVITDGRKKPIDNAFNRGETLRKNTHPTVKPTELMQYLVRLVSPNGATILDPFNGSGSTGKAVMYENKERNKNYKYIGIELTEEYLPISKARIEYVCNLTQEELKDKQLSIFDLGDNNELHNI